MDGTMASSATTAETTTTLVIDIGGTGIKMLRIDQAGNAVSPRARELTPRPAHPEPVLAVIAKMLAANDGFDRVSVGFPGVVIRGVVQNAPNLDDAAWKNIDLQQAIADLSGKPTRVINDADLQGYGVIEGRGVELVLTLGTGLGSALYADGHLVPNLEIGHHPFVKGKTYEERVSEAERKRISKRRFRKRVAEMLAQLQPIWNYERLYIGGGNAKRLDPTTLPPNVSLFDNVAGMQGGIALWDDTPGDA